jgi:hypothetical protein
MSLEDIPVVQRNKQKDFGFCGMFNYEVTVRPDNFVNKIFHENVKKCEKFKFKYTSI